MNNNSAMNKPLRLLTCAGLVLGAWAIGGVRAQQDPMYSMYMWNMMSVNPGYAGSADVMNLTAVARRQWVGLEGAPATNTFTMHTPMRIRALGFGASMVDDKIGPTHTTEVYGDLAYRIRVNKRTRLAFGLKAGVSSMRMSLTDVSGTDPNDPIYQYDMSGRVKPNFGFGAYYWNRSAYFGLSVPKLLVNRFASATELGQVQVYEQARHYFLIGGYVFKLSNDVRFRPSFLLKAVQGAPLSLDLSANFLFVERLWTGLAYRTGQELTAILSYQVNDQLRAGYSYDYALSGLQGVQSGSHELMISYDLSFTKHLLRSPRYF